MSKAFDVVEHGHLFYSTPTWNFFGEHRYSRNATGITSFLSRMP